MVNMKNWKRVIAVVIGLGLGAWCVGDVEETSVALAESVCTSLDAGHSWEDVFDAADKALVESGTSLRGAESVVVVLVEAPKIFCPEYVADLEAFLAQ